MTLRLARQALAFVLCVSAVFWLAGSDEAVTVAAAIAVVFAVDRLVVLPWMQRHDQDSGDPRIP